MRWVDKFKKFTETVAKETTVLGKKISINLQIKKEVDSAKNKMLSRIPTKKLKKLAEEYGVDTEGLFYEIYEDDKGREKRRKLNPTRKETISELTSNLGAEDIEEFCERNRINVRDISSNLNKKIEKIKTEKEAEIEKIRGIDTGVKVEKVKEKPKKKGISIEYKEEEMYEPEEEATQKLSSEFIEILDTIEKEFEPEPGINEKGFEDQILIFLKAKFHSLRPKRQIGYGGSVPDIVLGNNYALELKIAENKTILRNLIGQIIEYKHSFPNLAVVLIDTGRMKNYEVEDYAKRYEKFGAKTIIIRGNRRKGSYTKRRSIKIDIN